MADLHTAETPNLPPAQTATAGVDITAAAAIWETADLGAGDSPPHKDTVALYDNAVLLVFNGSGQALTVAIAATRECDQGQDHSMAVVVPNGKTVILPRLSQWLYGSSSNSNIAEITWTTSGTMADVQFCEIQI